MKPRPEDTHDLGFGSRMTRENQGRFLNRDGTFNVLRQGIPFLRTINVYHTLLTIPWWRFFGSIIAGYFLLNALFAVGYFFCGPGAVQSANGSASSNRLLDCFFFSVQSLSTSYGGLNPHGLAANVLGTFQSLAGLLFFAISTGLIFARFSRPVARIVFSRHALIAPYHGATAFEFRIMNILRNQLIDLEVRVVFSRRAEHNGHLARVFTDLPLEREKVTFFPLHLTVVHPINDQSPLAGLSAEDLEQMDAEFIVLLSGFDETFSQIVHSRSSYKHDEIVFGARFADLFAPSRGGRITIDAGKLHDFERELPQAQV